MPFSRMDFSIAKILVRANFLKDAKKRTFEKKHFIDLELPTAENGGTMMRGSKMVSVPSRRMYVGYRDIKPIKQGFGLSILSTPKGIMTAGEAKKAKLGGEHLCDIW